MTKEWMHAILGAWILISPWVLGFSSISVMKWSNVIVGLVLLLVNIFAIFGKDGEKILS